MAISHLVQCRFRWLDVILMVFVMWVLYSIVTMGMAMTAAFSPEMQPTISAEPANLPYYAGRSLLRMFIAFGVSLLFALLYGSIAAKYREAEKILIPLLDILQSIPVLGFLSVTITSLMGLFPNNLLGVELAAILAIFTGQAWNMTFSFYHSLRTIPKELSEVAEILQLNWYQKFVKLEVPSAMMGLVWNSMMSFGGGWFFLAASEAINVLGQDIRLPGIGSFMAVAIENGDMKALMYAMLTMMIMILVVDQLFWRPLVVWSQRFKLELTEASEVPTSWVYDLCSRLAVIQILVKGILWPVIGSVHIRLNAFANWLDKKLTGISRNAGWEKWGKRGLWIFCALWLGDGVYNGYCRGIVIDVSMVLGCFQLGIYTAGRVLVALLFAGLWSIPVGVWIGMNPRLAKIFQPVVQVAASFPANMVFPFVTILYLQYGVNFEYGAIPLMMLGTQWYILFNVIAGAMAVPTDLREAGVVFKLTGFKKWKLFILPAIFPYLITGMITASGGAWNASIVSELVSWNGKTLIASGLGAYISQVTEQGEWAGIICGIGIMCVFVVCLNHLLWQPLYRLAESKYRLD